MLPPPPATVVGAGGSGSDVNGLRIGPATPLAPPLTLLGLCGWLLFCPTAAALSGGSAAIAAAFAALFAAAAAVIVVVVVVVVDAVTFVGTSCESSLLPVSGCGGPFVGSPAEIAEEECVTPPFVIV